MEGEAGALRPGTSTDAIDLASKNSKKDILIQEEIVSNTARWIIGILLIALAIVGATFVFFGGAFSTVGCVTVPPDWIYFVLVATGLIALAAGLVPAILLLRRAKGRQVIVTLVIGLVLSCSGYGLYFYMLGNYC